MLQSSLSTEFALRLGGYAVSQVLFEFWGVTHYDYPMSTDMWPVQAFASVTCVLSLAVQKNLGTAAFEMRN